MISKLDITAIHGKLTPKTKKYVNAKIGGLDKYVPKNAKESLHAEVKLKEVKTKDKVKYACEVIMHLPGAQVTTNARGESAEASIDEAEAKLKIQLKKYKEKHGGPQFHHKVISYLKRR